jgi:hypothetical protein
LAKNNIQIECSFIFEIKTGKVLYVWFYLLDCDLSFEEVSSTSITLKEINTLENTLKKEYQLGLVGQNCPNDVKTAIIYGWLWFNQYVN